MTWFDIWVFDRERYAQMKTVGHTSFQAATLAVSMPFLLVLSMILGIICGEFLIRLV